MFDQIGDKIEQIKQDVLSAKSPATNLGATQCRINGSKVLNWGWHLNLGRFSMVTRLESVRKENGSDSKFLTVCRCSTKFAVARNPFSGLL